MRIASILTIFLLLGLKSFGQIFYEANALGKGQLFSEKDSPFWMHTNQRGRMDEGSHLFGLMNAKAILELDSDSKVELGGGILYKDGYKDGVKLDELFFSFESQKLGFVLGKKQRKDLFQGLSAVNENILWSLNAAPLPGIRIFTTQPFFISKDYGLGFRLSLEEYLMDDDRYIEDTRLHHKSFHIVYRNQKNFQIDFGVQHFVQWAGISEEFGELPSSFEDYTRIFTGRAGDESVGGQEVNALGNQIGSYEINVKTKIRDVDFKFIYNHIFEDGSGMKMGNFPDGRYAVFFEDNRDTFWGTSWLKSFMYEFYYTKNQSRDRASSINDGADNYFNNNLYRSGWTYNNQILGVPFILLNEDRFRIGTNILTVHHLGLRGEFFENYPYRFLLSYRKNYGAKDSFFAQTREVFSTLFELELVDDTYNLKAQIGADISNYESSNFGIGINFSKNLF